LAKTYGKNINHGRHAWSIRTIVIIYSTTPLNTGSSKNNAGIIETYHSENVKHIGVIQVSK
jgi:hypothetical protein